MPCASAGQQQDGPDRRGDDDDHDHRDENDDTHRAPAGPRAHRRRVLGRRSADHGDALDARRPLSAGAVGLSGEGLRNARISDGPLDEGTGCGRGDLAATSAGGGCGVAVDLRYGSGARGLVDRGIHSRATAGDLLFVDDVARGIVWTATGRLVEGPGRRGRYGVRTR